MCFKEVYEKVEELKDYSVDSILENLGVERIYTELVPLGKYAVFTNHDEPTILLRNNLSESEEKLLVLHEIGHMLFDKDIYAYNHRTEENNANLFMCLYLVHNAIWENEYFDEYLIFNGVQPKVARQFNDRVRQYKYQQIMNNGLIHHIDVNI